MDEKKRGSLLRQSSVVLISMVVSGVFTLLISVSLARILGPLEYGIYAVVLSVQMIVYTIGFFSIGPAVAKFIAESTAADDPRKRWIAKTGISLTLIISSISAIVYVVLTFPIGDWLYGEELITASIPFSALVVISSAFQGTVFGIVQGLRKISYVVWLQISAPVLSLVLVLLLVPSTGIPGAFIALASAQITISTALLIYMSRHGFSLLAKVPLSFRTVSVRQIIDYSLPGTISSVIVLPMLWLGNTELKFVVGFGAVGLFAVAHTMYNMMLLLPNSLVIPLFPKVSELSTTSMESVKSMISQIAHSSSILLFPIFLAAAVFSGIIIDVLFGASYQGAEGVAAVMLSLCYIAALSAVLGTTIMGLGRMWLGPPLDITYAATFLVIMIILVPEYGLIGLGFTYAVSTALRFIALNYILWKKFSINLSKTYEIIALSTIIFVAVNYVLISNPPLDFVSSLVLFLIGAAIMLVVGRGVFVSFAKRILKLS